MICNKILGKVTKFGGKRTKTLGVVNRFMVGGHIVPPLGFIGLRLELRSTLEFTAGAIVAGAIQMSDIHMSSTTFTYFYATPDSLMQCHMSSLGILLGLYDFSKSTNTQLSSCCPSLYFSTLSKVW